MSDTIFIILGVLALVLTWYSRSYKSANDDVINTLYRQAARYTVASLQDESEVIQVLHANYGMGYLLALRDISSESDFKRVTGEDLDTFHRKVSVAQDLATQRLIRGRPDLVPLEDPSLLKAMYSAHV